MQQLYSRYDLVVADQATFAVEQWLFFAICHPLNLGALRTVVHIAEPFRVCAIVTTSYQGVRVVGENATHMSRCVHTVLCASGDNSRKVDVRSDKVVVGDFDRRSETARCRVYAGVASEGKRSRGR